MNARMIHRGPDDEGVHVDEGAGVALGARRLSIIDVAGGHQPVHNEDSSVWAVLNGEIYNHPELQERLVASGHALRSQTDTEVLVHLYEDYGDDLVHALEGMYALVIWDARKRRLLVARDRFGEKPLFYTTRGRALVLASELMALQAGLGETPGINAEALDAFYVYGYVPGPRTMVQGVAQLPPAHVLTWDYASGEVVTRRYWRPPRFSSHSVDHIDAVAEVEAALTRSLRSRMISDVPLGVFLSGGLDSTLIATLAARLTRSAVKTFTIGYDVGDVNETQIARDVARAIGSDHHEVILTGRELAAEVPRLLGSLDHPIADQALVALHAVAGAARQEITVAVGGEGADELFGGYPRYRWLDRAERLRAVIPNRTAASAMRLLRQIGSPTTTKLSNVVAPVLTMGRHVDWVTSGRRSIRERLYGSALRELGFHQHPPELYMVDSVPWGLPIPSAFMSLDQASWLPDDVLQKADRATMLTSLEMRTPYLNHELAELAASIPIEVHMRNGGKNMLRQVLARTGVPLPRSGPKRAFRVPVEEWLRGPLDAVVDEQLASSAAYSEGWFDRGNVRKMIEEHRSERADNSAVLWPIMTFCCWLDTWRGT